LTSSSAKIFARLRANDMMPPSTPPIRRKKSPERDRTIAAATQQVGQPPAVGIDLRTDCSTSSIVHLVGGVDFLVVRIGMPWIVSGRSRLVSRLDRAGFEVGVVERCPRSAR
jgi:hypothetical protein